MRSSISKSVAAYFFVFLCLAGMCAVFRWGMGDLYGYKVRYALNAWQEQAVLPEYDEVSQVLVSANSALFWENDNPEYIELKARVLYYRALGRGFDKNGLADVVQAKELHLKAIQLRPNWPYSWANLVLMKSYLKEFDDSYNRALSNAVRFGPWEQSLHLTLSHAAALSWSSLSIPQKHVFAKNIERGIVRNHVEIRSTLDAFRKLVPVCAFLKRDSQQAKLCTSA